MKDSVSLGKPSFGKTLLIGSITKVNIPGFGSILMIDYNLAGDVQNLEKWGVTHSTDCLDETDDEDWPGPTYGTTVLVDEHGCVVRTA